MTKDTPQKNCVLLDLTSKYSVSMRSGNYLSDFKSKLLTMKAFHFLVENVFK
jgi:hypothetical protein